MKKVKLAIGRALMPLMVAASLGIMSYAAMGDGSEKAQQAAATLAFVGFAARLKTAGKYDSLDDSTKAFVDTLDTELKESFKDLVGTKALDEKLAAFKTEHGAGLSQDQMKQFNELITSVKDQAAALDKLQKAGGSEAPKGLKELLAENMKEIEEVFQRKSGHITLNIKAASIMTTANVVDDSDVPEDLIESFSVEEFVPKRRPRQFIFDIADRTTVQEITKYKTWLEEGSEERAFAIVAEGGLKPLVSFSLVRNVSEAKKAAGKYVVTEEVTKFRKEAYRIIQQIVNDKLIRDYAQIVTTSVLASAANYTGTTLDDQYADPTDYHAIGAVAAQIESLNFVPDVLILNPQDKWRIALQQTADGQFYVQIPTVNPANEVTMMQFRVVTSTLVAPGTFILGEGGLFKIEDETITVRAGYGISMNGTTPEADFDHNRFRVIVETWFHAYLASNHAGSFVKATFAEVKTALQA